MSDKHQYLHLSSQKQPFLAFEDDDCLESEDNVQQALSPSPTMRRRFGSLAITVVNIAVLLCTILLVLWSRYYSSAAEIRNYHIRQTNNHSPLFNDIDLPLKDTKMDGMLLDVHHSIFLADPSPDVDKAWQDLTKNDFVHVSGADIVKMGKDPQVCAKLPEEWGHGPDAYAAEMDIIHKIHCLDALRKEMHFDYYYGHKYHNRSEISEGHRMHANHCLNILLQTLTCDSNADLVPFVWVQRQTHPFPDFSIQRKCGDYGAVMKWKEDHAIDKEKFTALRKAEEEKPLKLLPELRRIFGFDDDHGDHNGDDHGTHHGDDHEGHHETHTR